MSIVITNNKPECQQCCKLINNQQKSLYCCMCCCKVHLNCTGMNYQDFIHITGNTDKYCWFCYDCISGNLPFIGIKDEIEYVNAILNNKAGLKATEQVLHNSSQLQLMCQSLKTDANIDADINYYENRQRSSEYWTMEQFNLSYDVDSSLQAFSILHVNARSLYKNIDKLTDITSQMNHKFSVIAVSETWTDATNEHTVEIEGYNKFLHSRTSGRGGGVALFIASELMCSKYSVLNDTSHSDFESIFVKVYIQRNVSIIVGCVYRPPGLDVNNFNTSIDRVLTKLDRSKSKCYIVGDYNLNLLNYDNHKATGNFLNTMFEHHYYPLITRPTRYSDVSSTLIDNIFTNTLNDNETSGILLCDISDHLPVFTVRSNVLCSQLLMYKTVNSRIISDEAVSRLASNLGAVTWDIDDEDVNVSYDKFLASLTREYNACLPLITKRIKIIQNCSKPWITVAIRKSIKKKNDLYKNWIKTRSDSRLATYKKYKNKLTSTIRAAERLYYNNRFAEVQGDLKRTWRLIKLIIHKEPAKQGIHEIKHNNKCETDQTVIANIFNEYFTNIGEKLASKIPQESGSPCEFIKNDQTKSNSIFMQPTTASEIINIVQNLKNDKAAGCDSISPKVLKAVMNNIVTPLCTLFNKSMESGIFPDSLKVARVTPIFKSGDKLSVNNYRPVSVLPVISKILERIIYNRLFEFLDKFKVLSDQQYGFKPKHSTCMAILNLIDKIACDLDTGKIAVGLFIDLSKAFDTIDHNILLDKLYRYGIRGIAFKLMQSYLKNRKQFVSIDNNNSSMTTVKCGVPQGSILGPLLFIIYINDIVNVSNILNMVLFADDTNLFLTGNKIEEITLILNVELCKLSRWFKLNELSLNISKTNYIVFRQKNKKLSNVPDILIDNNKIDMVHSSKFLGVIINERLTFCDHIKLIKQKISKSLGILKYVRYKLSHTILRSLYFTLINPYYEYCNLVWSSNRYVGEIVTLQKKAVRIICGANWNDHTLPLFKKMCILRVDEIHRLQLACFMFKVHHKMLPLCFIEMFTLNAAVHTHNTRQFQHYHVVSRRTNIMDSTVRIAGAKLWNNLSSSMKCMSNLCTFRNHYKQYLFSLY